MKNSRLAFSLLAVALVVVFAGLLYAQATGYRFSANGIVFAGTGTVCFEPTYNAGADVCIQRSGAGHISILNGNLQPNPDITGTATLVAGTKTVTFANAFTVAPVCITSWNGTGALTGFVKCVTTTTTAVFTSSVGTDTGAMNYLIVGNPN